MITQSVSVILPYYKESKLTVEKGIKKISSYFKKSGIDYEIIVSQNGRNGELNINYPSVKLIRDPRRGLGRAIKNALKVAKGHYSYFLSCEVPFELTDLKQTSMLKVPYDLVIGSKLHPKSVYKISTLRHISSWIFSRLCKIMIPNFSVNDPNGTLFGPTLLLKKYSRLTRADDFFYPTELIYFLLNDKRRVIEVPVVYVKKDSISSVHFISDGLKHVFKIIRLAVKERLSPEIH